MTTNAIITTNNFTVDSVVTAGEIKTNYVALKQAIVELSKSYEVVQYSDDYSEQIKQMKTDRANLNKLKDQIDTKRKEIKAAYNRPVAEMEEQFKELISLIDTPCKNIDAGIKSLEEEARSRKREEIRAFFVREAVVITDGFEESLYKLIYNPSWENVTATKKSYQEGIKTAIKNYVEGMTVLNAQEDFRDEAIQTFKQTLDLTAAMNQITRLKEERERYLAKERERIQREAEMEAQRKIREEEERIRAEERAKAERIRAEERALEQKRLEAERQAAIEREEALKASAAVQPTLNSSENALYIRVCGGMVIDVYSNAEFEVHVLDEDVASQREILDFETAIENLKKNY